MRLVQGLITVVTYSNVFYTKQTLDSIQNIHRTALLYDHRTPYILIIVYINVINYKQIFVDTQIQFSLNTLCLDSKRFVTVLL